MGYPQIIKTNVNLKWENHGSGVPHFRETPYDHWSNQEILVLQTLIIA